MVAARRALLGAFRVRGCGGRIGGGRRGRRTGTQRCLHASAAMDGRHVALEVHFESIVERSIEVDGEARDAHDGAVHLDEFVRELRFDAIASTAHENASGDAEVAVEPRVPQASAVVLHAHLQEVGGGRLGVGLQAGAGEVGVRADDHEPVAGACLAPTVNAHTALMLRVKKYFPPGLRWSQESRSEISCRVERRSEAGMSVTNGRCGRRAAGMGESPFGVAQENIAPFTRGAARRRRRRRRGRGRRPGARLLDVRSGEVGRDPCAHLETSLDEALARGEHGVVRRPRLVQVRHAVHRLLGRFGSRRGGAIVVVVQWRLADATKSANGTALLRL